MLEILSKPGLVIVVEFTSPEVVVSVPTLYSAKGAVPLFWTVMVAAIALCEIAAAVKADTASKVIVSVRFMVWSNPLQEL
jgi:hypothetical protein